MRRLLLTWIVVLLAWPLSAMAAGEAVLAHAMRPDVTDQASLQRGMQLFVNRCASCHSLEYQRFSRAAQDLGIPPDLMQAHLIFSPELTLDDTLKSTLAAEDGERWFGVAPPDLSLTARLRGTDWLYSFLLGFYRDPSGPLGVDNVVYPGVAMPNVLEPLQGVQARVCGTTTAPVSGVPRDSVTGRYRSCDLLELDQPGEMTPAEFEAAMFDLTNFLAYVAEPSRVQARALAPKVLAFIFLFGVIVYLLKRDYWKALR
ncbi:cytochrome c1 [Halomonas dongshanensis]|uniref:Cytochrome c1 n=1 Tax=Halomonas dongshanensis TaxID=2890835 RepID=A0ABT2EEK7_9GAMM|nr:cytochrome c1 [Halomonas dongshanensis]MCS2610021.1 cytochrome c1 [Halomonas dongshanensis]